MIKNGRKKEVINSLIHKEMVRVQKQYELQKNVFITKFAHKPLKRNSLIDINSRQMNHTTLNFIDYEGPMSV